MDRNPDTALAQGAKETRLQKEQDERIPPLDWHDLPLPKGRRLQYIAANILMYSWWYVLDEDTLS